jgi:hypothetical protein
MAVSVTCPHCARQTSTFDELINQAVRCRGCGRTFAAGGPAPAGPDKPAARRWEVKDWVLAGLAVPVVLAGVALPIVVRPGGVSARAEGQRWGQRELAGHLRRRGMAVDVFQAPQGPGGPAFVFVRPADLEAALRRCREGADPEQASRAAVELLTDGRRMEAELGETAVWVRVLPSAADAEDLAEAAGGDAFAWGRFLFLGGSSLLRDIRTALEG